VGFASLALILSNSKLTIFLKKEARFPKLRDLFEQSFPKTTHQDWFLEMVFKKWFGNYLSAPIIL
jgi:hypothetical protein